MSDDEPPGPPLPSFGTGGGRYRPPRFDQSSVTAGGVVGCLAIAVWVPLCLVLLAAVTHTSDRPGAGRVVLAGALLLLPLLLGAVLLSAGRSRRARGWGLGLVVGYGLALVVGSGLWAVLVHGV